MESMIRRNFLTLMLGVTAATVLAPAAIGMAAHADDKGGSDDSDGSHGSDSDSDDSNDNNDSNDDNGSDDDNDGTDDDGPNHDANDDNPDASNKKSGTDGCKSDPITCTIRKMTKKS